MCHKLNVKHTTNMIQTFKQTQSRTLYPVYTLTYNYFTSDH